jgi:hypothetical protein
MSRSVGIYYPTKLLDSKAYKTLTLQQTRIFHEFLLKRQFSQKGKQRKKYTGSFTENVTNNGKITFSYKEAENFGFTRPTYRTAIDQYLKVGLVDITKQGHGGIPKDGKITGECTEFAISDRWEKYGTPDFKKRTRTKDNRQGRGWAAYHAKKKQPQKCLSMVKD